MPGMPIAVRTWARKDGQSPTVQAKEVNKAPGSASKRVRPTNAVNQAVQSTHCVTVPSSEHRITPKSPLIPKSDVNGKPQQHKPQHAARRLSPTPKPSSKNAVRDTGRQSLTQKPSASRCSDKGTSHSSRCRVSTDARAIPRPSGKNAFHLIGKQSDLVENRSREQIKRDGHCSAFASLVQTNESGRSSNVERSSITPPTHSAFGNTSMRHANPDVRVSSLPSTTSINAKAGFRKGTVTITRRKPVTNACGEKLNQTHPESHQSARLASQRSNVMTASSLSEMYGACIPPYSNSPAAHPRPTSSIITKYGEHGPRQFRTMSHTSEQLPLLQSAASKRVKRSSTEATPTSSSSPGLRRLLSKRLRQVSGKRSTTEPIHISRPFPGHPDLLFSSPRPYEQIEDSGELPLHVKTAKEPSPINSEKIQVENELKALPEPHTASSRGGGKVGGNALARLKSLARRTSLPQPKTTGWRGKPISGPVPQKALTRLIELDESGDSETLPCLQAKDGRVSRVLRDRRRTSSGAQRLGSVHATEPWRGDSGSGTITPSSASSDSPAVNETEYARTIRHRRRAYYALEGLTYPHPNRSSAHLSIPRSQSKPRASKRIPGNFADGIRDSLALIRGRNRTKAATQGNGVRTREDSPTLPSSRCSSSSSSMDGTVVYEPQPLDIADIHPAFRSPSLPEYAIVSSHVYTKAWWEETASSNKAAAAQDEYSFVVGECERSESPSVKDTESRPKENSLSSSRRDSGHGQVALNSKRSKAMTDGRGATSVQVSDPNHRTASSATPRTTPGYTIASKGGYPRVQQAKTVVTDNRTTIPIASKRTLALGASKSSSHTIVQNKKAIIHQEKIETGARPSEEPSKTDHDELTLSSSDTSLEARASALRRGKQLKALNEYEAAHAVEEMPAAALSQCSLGLTTPEKEALKPKPLRVHPAEVSCDVLGISIPEREEDPCPSPASEFLSPCSSEIATKLCADAELECDIAPPIPPRSMLRPRLGGDWSSSRMQAMKVEILGEGTTSYHHPCNLSTIAEEASSMLSIGSIPEEDYCNNQGKLQEYTVSPTTLTLPLAPVSPSSYSDSASSDDQHNDHWWSDDDPATDTHNIETGATPAPKRTADSSNDTTPEKMAMPPAPDADNDTPDSDTKTIAEFLQYHSDRAEERRQRSAAAAARAARQERRTATANNHMRLAAEAREEKRRVDQANVDKANLETELAGRLRKVQDERREKHRREKEMGRVRREEEEERVRRMRAFVAGLRCESPDVVG